MDKKQTTIRLGKNDAALYDALDLLNGMDYAKANGEFFATNEKLRNLTGIATDVQLIRSIRKLEKNGIIDRKAGKRGEASVYVFHEVDGVVSKSVSENVSETENQRVMKKKRQNVSNNVSNVSEMLVKLNINELSEIITNIVSETIQPLRDELREINANLLKMSNTNTVESYTNKNENVSTDTDIETDKEKTNLKLNYSSTHAHEASADVPAGEAEDLSFRVFDEGNPTGWVDVLEGGDGSSRVADSLDTSADEDLDFDEFIFRGGELTGENTPQSGTPSSVATETYPQPIGHEKITPPDPPRGDVAPPQDAQNRHESDVHPSSGTVTHPQNFKATGRNYGGQNSITVALEAIKVAKETRERVGKIRDLEGCMAVVNAMDAAYMAVARVVRQAQEHAGVEVGYRGYLTINEVWSTGRSGWTEKQKNMIYRMAQDADNLMYHHPFKTRLEKLQEQLAILAGTTSREQGDNLKEKILNTINEMTAIADGNDKRTAEVEKIIHDGVTRAVAEHERLADMVEQFRQTTTLTAQEPATAYNTIPTKQAASMAVAS